MNECRIFGDAVAHSLGLSDAPTRTLRASNVAATRISCGPKQIGMTPQIRPEDTFIVALHLRACRIMSCGAAADRCFGTADVPGLTILIGPAVQYRRGRCVNRKWPVFNEIDAREP